MGRTLSLVCHKWHHYASQLPEFWCFSIGSPPPENPSGKSVVKENKLNWHERFLWYVDNLHTNDS